MAEHTLMKRRTFSLAAAGLSALSCFDPRGFASNLIAASEDDALKSDQDFRFNYIVGSCMYGYESLEKILPEVKQVGASTIDIWPKVHGNQREQIDEMGEDRFRELLEMHGVNLGCITQYKLGPFGLQEEMRFASRFGCQTMVTGAKGPTKLKGEELRSAVKAFIEQMKPHLEIAAETNVTIAIENHANSLIDSPDSIRYLMEHRPSRYLAVALAPYHLPQDEDLLAQLIRDCGEGMAMFYAWQHGNGCMMPQEKESELLQMPGRGPLDFTPLVQALVEIQYSGWTEIFMHPFPRGIPILDTTAEVSSEINRARDYLANCLPS